MVGRPVRANDADVLAHYRRRMIAPLLEGRTATDWRAARLPPADVDVLLHMRPLSAAVAQAEAAAMLHALPPDGIAVVASLAALPLAVLRRLAPHHAHYIQRVVTGSLFCEAAFEGANIAVLRDKVAQTDTIHIYLFAAQPLPPLTTGLLESPAVSIPVPRRAPEPEALPAPQMPQGCAASLAGRLIDQENRMLRLHARLRLLESEDRGPANRAGSAFPTASRFPWRMAEHTGPGSVSADPYDRRVDDPVIIEARRGKAFFETFGLNAPGARIAAAADVLAARTNLLAAPAAATDVSIIIPVYGQIAYTLNCLDSLFAHTSRYSAEVIIVDDASPDETGDLLAQLPQIRLLRQKTNGGFISSCNTGAALAHGRFIVMLNNDTRVVDGWLDALIGSFAQFPQAGLVGGKVLYPDGSLQEAGGIIWRDGSAWNYGRNDDPNRPCYAFARQADYISGCSIALRRETWESLGGFDPHYTPAYCEDADLCLRVVQSGQQVWFQPQARIVHYEGKTSGTDLTGGAKLYQVQNTKKLFLRWRQMLATHRPNGVSPVLEKERSITTRILVVDASTPTPDQDAGSVQTALGLQACRALGYGTSFVPQDNFLFQPGYTTDLQAAGIECAYAPYDLDMASYLRAHGRRFDVILVYRFGVLEKILPHIRAHAPRATLLFHVADLHFLRLQRQAALAQDSAMAKEAEAVRHRELAMVSAADCTITHSPVEAALLADLTPQATVAVWPLMFPAQGTARGFNDRRDVLFLGGYRHSPNVDAVAYFAAEILPSLRRSEPGSRFIAAGANPTAEVAALACESIEVTGKVADLRDIMDRARVFVCPLRVGAGVKGKIMTALAYGIPIVTTSLGIEGSGLEAGVHALVADDAESFVHQTLLLYRDADLWQRLSSAGLDLLRDQFSPERGAGFLESAITAAWAHKLGIEPA